MEVQSSWHGDDDNDKARRDVCARGSSQPWLYAQPKQGSASLAGLPFRRSETQSSPGNAPSQLEPTQASACSFFAVWSSITAARVSRLNDPGCPRSATERGPDRFSDVAAHLTVL